MTDATELRRAFFLLIADGRAAQREEGFKVLSISDDPKMRQLGDVGKTIAEALHSNGEPKKLESALEFFKRVPGTDYWHRYMETSGQVILRTGVLATENSARKLQLMDYGVRLIGMALSGSFPVSDATIEILQSIPPQYREAKAAADALAMRNEALRPQGVREEPSLKRPGRLFDTQIPRRVVDKRAKT